MFDLTSCHPTLLALHALATDDGFRLAIAGSHETTYMRAHAGWTTRLRAAVVDSDPCTCKFDSYGCDRYDEDTSKYIQFEIETELDGLGLALRGEDAATDVEDAVRCYVASVRSVAREFPLRLLRTRLRDIEPSSGSWPEAPFHTADVLAYRASIHWQLGDTKGAGDCYTSLLQNYSVNRCLRAKVQQRIDELGRGVAFENRARTSIAWL